MPFPVPVPDEGSVLFDLGSPYCNCLASGGINIGSALSVAGTGSAGLLILGGFGSGGMICGTSKDACGVLPNEAGLASSRPPPPPPPGLSCFGLLPPPLRSEGHTSELQ